MAPAILVVRALLQKCQPFPGRSRRGVDQRPAAFHDQQRQPSLFGDLVEVLVDKFLIT